MEPTKKRSHEEVKLSARDKKLKKEVDGYNVSILNLKKKEKKKKKYFEFG